jgi:hypothetical protein
MAFDNLNEDYLLQIDSSVVESDGYVEPKMVKVSFYEDTQINQVTNPDSFNDVVSASNYVYFKLNSDNVTYSLYTSTKINSNYASPTDATNAINNNVIAASAGDLFYFTDPSYNIIKSYSPTAENISDPWIYESRYAGYHGRAGLKFHYLHNSGENVRIDPAKSNIIDIYMLTADYDSAFRNWLINGVGTEPTPPTSASLENNYSSKLELVKTISDQIVYQPVVYKTLFGSTADLSLQATFKVVQSPTSTISSNSIISAVLSAINDFFALENWNFGQSFYFSELSAYIMNLLSPNITNFVIVPVSSDNGFGSLYEVSCQSNEIFISSATSSNIQVIGAITAAQLNATSTIINTSK